MFEVLRRLGRKILSLRMQLGMTQKEFGAKLAALAPREDEPVPQTTIAKWENNLQQPRPDKVARLAKLAKVTPNQFMGLEEIGTTSSPGRSIQVMASLRAGAWSETAEWPEDDRYEIPAKLPPKWDAVPITAAEVEGDSMNEFYPDGSTVFLAPLEFIPGGLKDRMHVMVVRRGMDGTYESTLKEYREEGGKKWLVPRSTSPAHTEALPYAKRGTEVSIKAVVVSSFTIAPGMN